MLLSPVARAARRAVAADDVIDDRLARLEDAATGELELRPELGDHLGDGAADVVLDRQPVHLRERVVDAHEAEVAVKARKPDRSTALKRLHQGRERGTSAFGVLEILLHHRRLAKALPQFHDACDQPRRDATQPIELRASGGHLEHIHSHAPSIGS